MKYLAIIMVLALSACTLSVPSQTTNQRFYGLVSDYAALQNVAVSYKKNCDVIPTDDCKNRVKVIQSVDKKANTIIQAARSNTDQPDYVAASYQALTVLYNDLAQELK